MSVRDFALRRLRWLVYLCERTLFDSPPRPLHSNSPIKVEVSQCPWCMARGSSVVDDDAGRFVACLVCGISAASDTMSRFI